MTSSRSSRRGASARRALLAEIEQLAGDLRGPLGRIEEAVTALVAGEGVPADLPAHALFEGGIPRIRPVLVVLAARIADEEPAPEGASSAEGTFEVAAVVELLHLSLAFHDAALGAREGRRRRIARRVLRGATSWLGASHLTLRALELARRAPSPEILGEALDALRELTEGYALGESLRQRAPELQDALLHAESHVGVVFAFACRAGGRLAGLPRPELTALGRYGRHLGVAWQIAEDLAVFDRGADAVAREAMSGRPLVPVSAAAARNPALAARWGALGVEPSPEAARGVAAEISAAGGFLQAREALVSRAWMARSALTGVREGSARGALERLADALVRGAGVDGDLATGA